MYQANIEIEQLDDLSQLKITDISTGDETPTSRKVTIFKTDLIPQEVTFNGAESSLIVDGFTKDYALTIVFSADVDTPVENSIYEDSVDIVMTGYSEDAFEKRVEALELDESITSKKAYMETTLELEYYITNAQTFGRIGDLVKAQKSLDYIRDISGY